jgi:hypothetical protein
MSRQARRSIHAWALMPTMSSIRTIVVRSHLIDGTRSAACCSAASVLILAGVRPDFVAL